MATRTNPLRTTCLPGGVIDKILLIDKTSDMV
jgi:hypothetical protein